ncbi:MAG: FG-GAP repeat domain-containing protein, partial [Acidobacteriota bacterium]
MRKKRALYGSRVRGSTAGIVVVSAVLLLVPGAWQPALAGRLFAPPMKTPGNRFFFTAAADLDGDGILDLVGSRHHFDQVAILPGNGDGTFAFHRQVSVGNQPGDVLAADLDGDGLAELVVARPEVSSIKGGVDDVAILRGEPTGDFTLLGTHAVGVDPNDLATGDFDDDGITDLAVANRGWPVLGSEGDVSILLGQGDGGFKNEIRVATGGQAQAIAVGEVGDEVTVGHNVTLHGDLDGDGHQDLVVARDERDAAILVRLGNGDGTFRSPPRFAGEDQAFDVAIADFNQDGKPDVVFVDPSSFKGVASVFIQLGNGDGTLAPPAFFKGGDHSLTLAVDDFNGDGRPDVVTGTGDG